MFCIYIHYKIILKKNKNPLFLLFLGMMEIQLYKDIQIFIINSNWNKTMSKTKNIAELNIPSQYKKLLSWKKWKDFLNSERVKGKNWFYFKLFETQEIFDFLFWDKEIAKKFVLISFNSQNIPLWYSVKYTKMGYTLESLLDWKDFYSSMLLEELKKECIENASKNLI